MSTEFRGVKDGDFVEVVLAKRRSTHEPRPWNEEVWDEFTYYGKAYMAYRQVTCPDCDGRTYLPNSNGAFDFAKPTNPCKKCEQKGTVDDPAKMGELHLKTTRGFDVELSAPVPWNPPLAMFRDVKKISEDKKGTDDARKSYEIKEGKQVAIGTAKADWIALQKRMEKTQGGRTVDFRPSVGDWRMWEGR